MFNRTVARVAAALNMTEGSLYTVVIVLTVALVLAGLSITSTYVPVHPRVR